MENSSSFSSATTPAGVLRAREDGDQRVVHPRIVVHRVQAEKAVELRARGRVFHTGTDTEVLLAAWQEAGEAILDRIVGMFAFALWDARHERLVIVRDRMGIKPLYYGWAGEHYLEVQRPGYETERVEFSVEAGDETEVTVDLGALQSPGS